jgi:sugar-specific transcriptional regulator TrmB
MATVENFRQKWNMDKETKKSLKELGFSENEIKVYLALTGLGEASAAVVAKKVELPRTTAISLLAKLEKEGYLASNKYRGKIYYWTESPRVLAEVFSHKVEVAQNMEGFLTSLYRQEKNFPFVKNFDTKKSIGLQMEKIVSALPKKSIIKTIDTPQEGNYRKIFSENMENVFMSLKNKHQLLTKTLVPHATFKGVPEHKLKIQSIEIRELPAEVNFKSSVWLIGGRLVFFSGNPPFLVIINHPAIVEGFRGIYDFLWSVSTSKN